VETTTFSSNDMTKSVYELATGYPQNTFLIKKNLKMKSATE